MFEYRRVLSALSVVLILVGLLWLSVTVVAQEGDGDAVKLKAEAWRTSGLSQLPLLPSSSTAPLAGRGNLPATQRAEKAPWYRIAFQSYRDGNWEIYWMDRNGADQRRLTNDPNSDVDPRLSPDLTEVAFTSNRNGNWEIYKMKTDGTGLKRLTINSTDDAQPAWSADGSKIAFIRKVNGLWRIYRMGADGMGQSELTHPVNAIDMSPTWSPDGSQIAFVRVHPDGRGDVMLMQANGENLHTIYGGLRYLQHLVWSPDGQHLAFDCDLNGDGWNQINIFYKNGSWEATFPERGPLQDLWMGGWSPDSQYIIFSEVSYVVQEGKLYIAETNLKKAPISLEWESALPSSGMDMSPDWQRGIDNQAPTASIQALPAVSPAPVSVHWTGTDAGPAGVVSYDVQVRSDGGAWNDWLKETTDTHGYFYGRGGHHYAFRVRSRDEAGNLSPWTGQQAAQTTVESQAPRAAFDTEPWPSFLFYRSHIFWHGEDVGGSGIGGYDVQYRESDSATWSNWLENTAQTRGYPPGEIGKSYFLRVRAIDKAQNVGPWVETKPASTIYQWGISGSAYDNRHRPVAGVVITSTPTSDYGGISNPSGAYDLYSTQWSKRYSVWWQKDGYGPLPTTTYLLGSDVHADVVLPPPDNVVLQPSFETAADESVWQQGGEFPGRLQKGYAHTGERTAVIGVTPFQTNRSILSTGQKNKNVRMVTDDKGNKHLIWRGYNDALYYARIDANGNTSPVKQFGTGGARSAKVVVSRSGVVHAVWLDPLTNFRYLFYAVSHDDGTWSQRKLDMAVWFTMAVDEQGIFHLVYSKDYNSKTIYYQQRLPNGQWKPLERMPYWPAHYTSMVMLPASDGTLYFIYPARWHANGRPWTYLVRHTDGRWDIPKQIPATARAVDPVIRIDAHHVLHFLMEKEISSEEWSVNYLRLEPDGRWSEETILPQIDKLDTIYDLFLGEEGQPRIIIAQQYPFYLVSAWQDADGVWRSDEQAMPVEMTNISLSDMRFAMDHQGRLYMVTRTTREVVAGVRPLDGLWRFWIPSRWICPDQYDAAEVGIVVDGHDVPAITWLGAETCDVYAANALNPGDGSSWVQQPLTIPTSLNAPTLSFFYRFPLPLPSPSALQVHIDDGVRQTTVFTSNVAAPEWTQQWVDMSPWSGRTVTVTFEVPQKGDTFGAWAEIDDVTLGSSAYPDLWVSSQPLTPKPGDTLHLSLPYGNMGDALSESTQLTLTLPLTLSLVASDPPPDATPADHVWLWHVGDLAPHAPDQSLNITVTVPSSVSKGAVMTGTVRIDGPTSELVTWNNQQQFPIFVGGSMSYLPSLSRTARPPSSGK